MEYLKRVKWLKAFFRTWGQFTLFSWILIGCWTLFWLALLMLARTRVLARLLPRTCYFRGIPDGSFCNSLLLCLVTFIALFGQVLWRVTRKFSILVIIIVESAEKLNAELRELRVQHYTLKEQYDDLKEKMKFFTKVIFKGRLTLSFLPLSHCFHVGDISPQNSYLYPLRPKIIMHFLHTVLFTSPKVLTRRICLTITSFRWWSFPLFSWQ